MNGYTKNGSHGLAMFETPFSDTLPSRELGEESFENFQQTIDSPFSRTFESGGSAFPSQLAEEFVQFLGDLNNSEFTNALYEAASELEETWRPRVSNEIAMGESFVPFATQQARAYLQPLIVESEQMIDNVMQHFSGNVMADQTEAEIESFFNELEFDHRDFTPAQEQLFGGLLNKVKSVVKKGVDLAKKGINAVGKLLPINIVLGKLKGLIRPLLDKVLKFAIGKLPKNLQPHAQTLAKRFLNLESAESFMTEDKSSAGELDALQQELDSNISALVFGENEADTQGLVMEYENSFEQLERTDLAETGGVSIVSLPVARQQFIQELRELRPGQDPTPVIEKFLPAAVMALQPVIKMAISIIGRPKIINFIAGLLAQLVSRYVPENVARPLAASIADIGLRAIGFETSEMNKSDLAYEAIANTIEETVHQLGNIPESELTNGDALTLNLLEAFEIAAANNFPAQYIKTELRRSVQPGVWVVKPRNSQKHHFKKFTRIFDITIDPQAAQAVTSFRGLPLTNFLRDKLGLDPTKGIKAKVHLYEAIQGTKLSSIAKHENLPGFNSTQPFAWVQLHPLTSQAASLLLKEPVLGKDVDVKGVAGRHRTAIGQRFYFLEIQGARLRIPPVDHSRHKHGQSGKPSSVRPSQSADVQAVINFVKSSIAIHYYFSEEDAKELVEKLNKNDAVGAAISIRNAIRKVLNTMLQGHVGNKVKIIHEAFPELYLENIPEEANESVLATLAKKAGGIALGGGKQLVKTIIEKLIGTLSEKAYESLIKFFKERSTEFKNAQAEPQDGVTVKLTWNNIAGMAGIRAAINALRGNISLGSITDLAIPSIPTPEIKIIADKKFD
jgi:hypothetical protein